MKFKNYILHTLLILILTNTANGQLSKEQSQNIDSLFMGWNKPNHPGGSIAVMQNGKVVFSKGYGLSSLEYLSPNSTETIFNIGSISKQFTAMGIVLLEEQGKLSFDDDVKKHIPEFPDFGNTITIRHLLHHTSGLRDIHGLLALAGWRGSDEINNDDVNRILLKQNKLNFTPEDKLMYSNTGYIIMVTIIESITGQKFKSWMKQNIFEELGLINTYVEDQFDRVVVNNATSYHMEDEFTRNIDYWNYIGSGNLHSTTSDMLKWSNNFSNPKEGWQSAFEKLQITGVFNDGKKSYYGFGLRIEKHMGKKIIQHGGSIGGFRAVLRCYPDDELNIVLLTNFRGSDIIYRADKIAEFILTREENKVKPEEENSPEDPYQFIKLSKKKLSKFEGTYWEINEKYGRKIYVKNDTLMYSRSGGSENALIPISKNTFKMLGVDVKLIVKFEVKPSKMTVLVEEEPPYIFELIDGVEKADKKELSGYIGRYYSPEMETNYSLTVEKGEAYVHFMKFGKIKLKRIYKDKFEGSWPVNNLEIKRNKRSKVIGLQITNGRTMNVWFDKISN